MSEIQQTTHSELQSQITIVSQVFYPDQQSTSLLLSDLASQLSQQGVNVHVLASYSAKNNTAKKDTAKTDTQTDNNTDKSVHKNIEINTSKNTGKNTGENVLKTEASDTQSKDSQSKDPKFKHRQSEVWNGVHIHRGGVSINAKRSMLHRAVVYLAYLSWLIIKLFTVPKKSIILVVTNPPFAPLLVSWVTKIRGTQYVVLLHDVYPDGLISVGKLQANGVVSRIWRSANHKCFERAHSIVVLGRDMKARVQQQYHVSAEKIQIIPNWSLIEVDQPIQAEETQLWSTLSFPDERILLVQYSGNMGLWHDLDILIEAAKILESRHLPVYFLMIGHGIRAEEAKNKAKNLGLRQMMWLPFQPLSALTDSLQCAHMGIVTQRPDTQGIMVPSKLYGILAMGRGVLALVPQQSEVALSVQEGTCGVVCDPNDPSALADQLSELFHDPEQVRQYGISARTYYQGEYGSSRATQAFISLFAQIES